MEYVLNHIELRHVIVRLFFYSFPEFNDPSYYKGSPRSRLPTFWAAFIFIPPTLARSKASHALDE